MTVMRDIIAAGVLICIGWGVVQLLWYWTRRLVRLTYRNKD